MIMSKHPLHEENQKNLNYGLISSIITNNWLSKNTLGLGLADSIIKQSEFTKKILYPGLADSIIKNNASSKNIHNSVLDNSIVKQSELSKNILNSGINNTIMKQVLDIQKSVSIILANSLITKNQGIEFASSVLKIIQEQSNLINPDDIKLDQRVKIRTPDIINNNSHLMTETMKLWLESLEKSFADGLSGKSQAAEKSETESTSKQNKQSKTNLNDKFASSFKALPFPAQAFLLWLFSQILLASFNNYLQEKTLNQINKVEAYVISLINNKPISKTDIIKENKDIDWGNLNNFRFITGDNVRLRATPSMNSEVIENIGKNTIVAVLGKEGRQWLFVQVQSGDETITGWVTRTYTKPLKS